MEIEQKLKKLSNLFTDDVIEFKKKWLSSLYFQRDVIVKKQQIFLDFNINDIPESQSKESLVEHLEIVVQILINQGYSFVVYNADEKQNDTCEKFVEVFKNEAIKYIGQIKNDEVMFEKFKESGISIVMSKKCLFYALVLEKPFISLLIDERIKNIFNMNKNFYLNYEELNVGVILKKIIYLLDHYALIKKELSTILETKEDAIEEYVEEIVVGEDEDNTLDTEEITGQIKGQMKGEDNFETYRLKLKQNIQSLIDQGFLTEAKDVVSQYEEIVDSDIEIYSIKGVIAMMEGDMQEAERVLGKGLTLNRNHFDLNYNMGYLCQLKELKKTATEYYKKALSNAENDADVDDITGILKTLVNEDGIEETCEKDSKCSEVSQIDENITIINTDDMEAPSAGSDLYSSRENIYNSLLNIGAKTATIVIQGYNRLEKTKYCVECVLNYTKDIDYELILIDNGSSDGTFEYFKTVKYPEKKILRLTKNAGAFFPTLRYIFPDFISKYLVVIPNDVYVTANWLSNLLKCMETDKKIGWVMPMSSNISNLQDPGLSFDSLEEMQQKAKDFNKSDPSKWQKRLRLVTPLAIYKKETIDVAGKFDVGFFHDFGEDDYSIRLRRMGYRLILCGDTFVHHDHDFRNLEGKDSIHYKQSLEKGRKNFKEKYYGLDAWDDIVNYEKGLINLLPTPKKPNSKVHILGIDVRCGTPILEIENLLVAHNRHNYISSAFTTQAKYYLDLKTICEGNVYCDRIEYIDDYLKQNYFDYIVIGEPINKYLDPIKLLDSILKSAKKGSKVLFKLINNNDVNKLLEIYGSKNVSNDNKNTSISFNELLEILNSKKVTEIKIAREKYDIDQASIKKLRLSIEAIISADNSDVTLEAISTKEYFLCIEKS